MLPNENCLIVYSKDEENQPTTKGCTIVAYEDFFIPIMEGSEQEVKVKMIKEKIMIRYN